MTPDTIFALADSLAHGAILAALACLALLAPALARDAMHTRLTDLYFEGDDQ